MSLSKHKSPKEGARGNELITIERDGDVGFVHRVMTAANLIDHSRHRQPAD